MDAGGAPVTGDDGYATPRWEWPEYPDDAVVEIRVHGVGGEGPEGMTRDPHPVRVGGDAGVGFWRARNPEVPGSPRHVREVVSWGGTTSGHPRSAFWVLLLPFALFNAAGRMAPAGSSRARVEAHQAICRLLALCMTLTIVALTTGVALDLLALQCGAVAGCATAELTGRWLLAPLRWFTDDAAALVALLSLLAAGVPYLLRLLGRRGVTGTTGPGGPVPLQDRAPQRLDDADFWQNRWPSWRLRGLHITAGYAWVVAVLGMLLPPLLPTAQGWLGGTAWVGIAGLVACAVVVATPRVAGTSSSTPLAAVVLGLRWLVLGALGVLVGTGLSGAAPWLDRLLAQVPLAVAGLAAVAWSTRLHVRHVRTTEGAAGPSGTTRDAALAVGSAALAAAAQVAGTTRVATVDALGVLPDGGPLAPLLGGMPAPVYGPLWLLVGVDVVLLLALVATSLGAAGSDRSSRGPLPTAAVPGNLAAPVLALLSLLLVTAVGNSIHGFLLDWLGRRVPVIGATPALPETADEAARAGLLASREAVGLALPWSQPWTAVTIVATLLVLGATTLVLRRRVRASAPLLSLVRDAARRALDGPPDGSVESERVLERTRQRWLDQVLIQRAGAALGIAVGLLVATVAAVLGPAVARGEPLGEPFGATAALTLVALLPPLGVALIRNARQDRLLRRQLAALWDVLAFWPRVTHPFSPPSYGEALVPAVTARVNVVSERYPVILAGHSQGSVVGLAVALHPQRTPRPLHLVTYGSPLRILYEGFFPTVFGGDDGAIARGTPTTPWATDEPVGDRAHSRPVTWHNVLGLSEPLGTPLWSWSVPPATTAATSSTEAAWDVHMRLAWASCPVCGWTRPTPDDLEVLPVPTPPVAALDVTVTDPDRVVSPSGEVDGVPLGHSTYHRSREFDDHLATLAARIRAAGRPR